MSELELKEALKDKELQTRILRDTVKDYEVKNKKLMKVCKVLFIIFIFLFFLVGFTCINCQKRLVDVSNEVTAELIETMEGVLNEQNKL